jgi:hypothetical protein
MELVKEALPKVSRVAVLWQPTYDGGLQWRASEAAARSLGVRLQALKVERPDEFVAAFAEVQKHRAEALIVSSSALFYVHRTRLVEFAAKHRLPTIYHQSEFVVGSGGLMSYGPDFHDLTRRSATYVDKILKGAKPGDLPIEQPTKFELITQNRQGPRPHDPPVPPPAGGSGDRVSPARKPPPPKRKVGPPKAGVRKPLAEELAHDAVAHEKAAPGDRVELVFRVRLPEPVAEALTARAVREEKNLVTLVAEILEAAAGKGKA